MAMVDAIVTGLPVLATDVPRNREVLTAERCGLLVASQWQMGQAMEWMATDPEARQKLAGLSAAARGRFSIEGAAALYRSELMALRLPAHAF